MTRICVCLDAFVFDRVDDELRRPLEIVQRILDAVSCIAVRFFQFKPIYALTDKRSKE